MRLRLELAILALAAGTALGQAPAPPTAERAAPTRTEIDRAIEELKQDPSLAAERTIRMLRWAENDAEESAEPRDGGWLEALFRWVRGLFDWLAGSGRVLVWLVGAVLLAGLAGHLARLLRQGGLPQLPNAAPPPTHVRDLDIRPESLPDDVGAAALNAWQRGEQRAALALLYRGALSRLAHRHGVPILASATEGECAALARPRLGTKGAAYVTGLIDTWGAAVYGGRLPSARLVENLCNEFAAALDEEAA